MDEKEELRQRLLKRTREEKPTVRSYVLTYGIALLLIVVGIGILTLTGVIETTSKVDAAVVVNSPPPTEQNIDQEQAETNKTYLVP